MLELEPAAEGPPVEAVTFFLTGSECPWRCLMCDLWMHTAEGATPAGSLPAQMEKLLRLLPPRGERPRHLKLYNAGSFADVRAVPPADYGAIARLCAGFDRIIVECHPALVGESLFAFGSLLESPFEVAMGLETAQPEVLARLNKGMTLDQYRSAARRLVERGIGLRSFVLLRPPWMTEAEGVEWAVRSTAFAFDCGAGIVAIVPTRPGNGALDELQRAGEFSPPTIEALEEALSASLALGAGRVVADLWDLERFSSCDACYPARRERLERMNLEQRPLPRPPCASCSSAG